MAQLVSDPVARVLVVDDEPSVRQLLCQYLVGLNLLVKTACDGVEAEHCLSTEHFDLLILDLDMPRVTGEQLLETMRTRSIRPESVVVMSASANLAWATLRQWSDMGVSNLLPKPFMAGDVKAIVRRVLAGLSKPREVLPASVLVAGNEPWAEALSQMLSKSGGQMVRAADPSALAFEARALKPEVMVLGSATLGDELEPVVRSLHLDPALCSIPIVVARGADGIWSSPDLLEAGATLVLAIPQELPDLATTVARLAGLSRRVHPRAPLESPVTVTNSQGVLVGSATDISVGGLGIKGLKSCPPREILYVGFRLPDDEPEPLVAVGDLTWARRGNDKVDPEAFHAGVRFTALETRFRERVRFYVAQHGIVVPARPD